MFSLTICDVLSMHWTTTQLAPSAARRHCGEISLKPPVRHVGMWRNSRSADEERLRWCLRLGSLSVRVCVCVCMSVCVRFNVLLLSSPAPLHLQLCVQTKIFLIFFPAAYSQRDLPESAFDLSTMLGSALSVQPAVGRCGGSIQHTVTRVKHLSRVS